MGAPGQATTGSDDKLLGLTRAGMVVLLVLAIANAGFLYFFPSHAKPDYAWAIAPPVSAAFIGAGYLAGAVGVSVGIFAARHYRSVRALVPAFCALGIVLFAATLIHNDRFRWDYALTWMWTVVYAGIPLAAIFFWWRQNRLSPAKADSSRDAGLAPLRVSFAVLGTVLAAVAVALFVAPDRLLEEWPWPLTELMARVFAGWYALAAGTLLYSAATVRRAHEIPIPQVTIAAWSALLLPLPLLYRDSMQTGASLYAPWIALQAIVLAVCGWAIVRSALVMRAEGQRL